PGAINAYAVSSSDRLTVLPDVPTAAEAGIDYQMSIWAGIFAPKGTSQAIVEVLAAALDKALDEPTVQKRLAELGGSIPPKDEWTPVKFASFVKAEIARWSPILHAVSPEGQLRSLVRRLRRAARLLVNPPARRQKPLALRSPIPRQA